MSVAILAIETSCDETAMAAILGFHGILGECVLSQIAQHAAFGGVVPEVASRSHLEALPAVLETVLASSGRGVGDFDAYAATAGPGLAPALLVGAAAARGLAAGARKPYLAINHIEGHLLSPFFGQPEIPPHTGLVVSGGHTLLFDVAGFRQYTILGRTLDDAAGEAFDKTARLLGLPYPGGVEIERLARHGDPARFDFPRAMPDSLDFSFSGLKTAVRIATGKGLAEDAHHDLCASFQQAVADVLARKLARAATTHRRPLAAISGGVSANQFIVEHCRRHLAAQGVDLVAAPADLRRDNAVMIAYAAALDFAAGTTSPPSNDVSPTFRAASFPSL